MKGYTKDNVLYVFPQEVGEIPSVGAVVTEILVQQEDLAAWKTANSDYASIMKAYNYNVMTVQKKVWADHLNDDIQSPLVSPELAWSAESATVTIGADDNVFPTLSNPHSVSVWYTTNDDCIDIDQKTGEITLLSAGTADVDAIFDGDDTYEEQDVTYELTVNSASVDYESQYFTIKGVNGPVTISRNELQLEPIYISTDDGSTWEEFDSNYTVNSAIFKHTGQLDINNGPLITVDDDHIVEGNIMSLLYGDDFVGETDLSGRAFNSMFRDDDYIISAENLILPATTLLSDCYANMFSGCSSLTTAPELPATTLTNRCYFEMFSGCESLNYIKCLATNINAMDCTDSWVDGVAASGTFVKAASAEDWPSKTGNDGIPSGWTVQDAAEEYE